MNEYDEFWKDIEKDILNFECKTTPSISRFERTCVFPVSEDNKKR